jgi:hypothetical protein
LLTKSIITGSMSGCPSCQLSKNGDYKNIVI